MILPIYSLAEAQLSILKRELPDEFSVPESILEGIEKRFGERLTPEEAVKKVIRDVRQRGDAALREWSKKIDGTDHQTLQFDLAEIQEAKNRVPSEVCQALTFAADRIRDFHRKQPATSWIESQPAGILGQLVRPIERVGIYVPGGTAPLPSTLLMCAIPAQVAGVREIIVCTPSDDPVILQAAATIGVDKIYRLGGGAGNCGNGLWHRNDPACR